MIGYFTYILGPCNPVVITFKSAGNHTCLNLEIVYHVSFQLSYSNNNSNDPVIMRLS
jgi:hypothetical protein